MNNKNLMILLCSLVLTCACVNRTVMDKPAPVSDGDTKINNLLTAEAARQDHGIELLAFIENYSNLAPDAQKKIFSETTQALAENKNDLKHRIKLACMLALPGSYARDSVKAQPQLQNLIQENILNPADLALVNLLYEYTTDIAKQAQKYREESKKLDSIQQKYGALEQKNEVLEQKNKELEQKLYELKNIEKTMSERGAKPSN